MQFDQEECATCYCNLRKDRNRAKYKVEEAGYSAKHSAQYLEDLYRGCSFETK